MKSKLKELNEHPGSSSDPPIGLGRKRGAIVTVFYTFFLNYVATYLENVSIDLENVVTKLS